MDTMAFTEGFDPLITDNWYSVLQREVLDAVSKKGVAWRCADVFIGRSGCFEAF